jgi:hypothetical protein
MRKRCGGESALSLASGQWHILCLVDLPTSSNPRWKSKKLFAGKVRALLPHPGHAICISHAPLRARATDE